MERYSPDITKGATEGLSSRTQFPLKPTGIRESGYYIRVLANHANRFVRRQFNKRDTCPHFSSSLLTVQSANCSIH